MVVASWIGGWRRVAQAFGMALGLHALTFLLAVPFAMLVRDQIAGQLGPNTAHAVLVQLSVALRRCIRGVDQLFLGVGGDRDGAVGVARHFPAVNVHACHGALPWLYVPGAKSAPEAGRVARYLARKAHSGCPSTRKSSSSCGLIGRFSVSPVGSRRKNHLL